MATDTQKATEADELRLSCFEIQNLYREFSYRIPLKLDQHVTAIIAPNGSGKTICLRMIDALFNSNWALFEATDFERCIFSFTDGSTITVTKRRQKEVLFDDDKDETLQIELVRANKKRITWSPLNAQSPLLHLDQYVPFLSRLAPNVWIDERTNQRYGPAEAVKVFGDFLPARYTKRISQPNNVEIVNFVSRIQCKLIETQRLFIFSEPEDDRYATRGKRRSSIYAISQKSELLRRIMSEHINKYAALSQSLDRSFPSRVIRPQETNDADEIHDVEKELSALDARRQQLTEVGILDVETDAGMGVPKEKVQDAIAQVLRVYIRDNREKLSTLDEIYSKISLFRSLLASRFGKKQVEINKSKGLNVLFGGRQVPIEALSSGEQHQLVLFFELLFQTPRNSLILIDEPEISLHIAWQKKFITDLMGIITLNHFDVVLATHSPQLIGKWEDLVIELGDVYEGDAGDGK